MKKLAVMLAVAFAVAGLGVDVRAEEVCTAFGCARADQGGYILVVDGDPSMPDPLDGFISVRDDGQVCAADNGREDDGDPLNGPESDSPTCYP